MSYALTLDGIQYGDLMSECMVIKKYNLNDCVVIFN
jgi:hypothetical protein